MTTPTQWIAAALKILSVWLFVGAITSLPSYAGMLFADFSAASEDPMARAARWSTIGGFVGLLMTFAVSVVLWRRSGALAGQIWADAEPASGRPGELTADRLQLIAFSLFGLYLLLSAAPSLLEQALAYRAIRALPSDFRVDPARSTQLLGSLVLTGLQIVFGLWLLLYPDGLAALLRRLRDAITFADTERRKDDPDRE
jgi:hypothetical protein